MEGRTIGGRAILRLRDVTGDRSELLQAQAKLATARSDLRSMTMLLDDVAHPLWIRDADDTLLWANQAYLRSVEASDLDDAIGPLPRAARRADPRGGAAASARPARPSRAASPPSSPASARCST